LKHLKERLKGTLTKRRKGEIPSSFIMITIPISVIFSVLMFTFAGAAFGVLFTIIFMFGCDNKWFIRNMVIGVLSVWCAVFLMFATKSGLIVWS
jgi:hypothetical protein